MNEISKVGFLVERAGLSLEEDEGPDLPFTATPQELFMAVAKAQLAKALREVVKWIPMWMAEAHPEDECGGECVCTRNHFVEGLLNGLERELKAGGIDLSKE